MCGKGHGTRLVNYLKASLVAAAHSLHCAALLLTQADSGGPARHFWARQRLRATPQSLLLVKALYEWQPLCGVYLNAVRAGSTTRAALPPSAPLHALPPCTLFAQSLLKPPTITLDHP